MELKLKKEIKKSSTEVVQLSEQDCLTLVELFVKHKLPDSPQEVFYAQMLEKEVTVEHVKNALFQAVLSNMSVLLLKLGIEQYETNPEQFKMEMEKYFLSMSQEPT